MTSNKLSIVASCSLGLINEYLETLNFIFTLLDYLEPVLFSMYRYLLFCRTSFKKSFAFLLS